MYRDTLSLIESVSIAKKKTCHIEINHQKTIIIFQNGELKALKE